jgi:hypothetical protein
VIKGAPVKKTFSILSVAIMAAALSACGKKDSTTGAAETSSRKLVSNACTVYTLDDAKEVMGAGAKRARTSLTPTSSDDIVVTTCAYDDSSTPGVVSSVLIQSAKTDIGEGKNKSQFATPPAGSQNVVGYGVSAYWNPKYGQLNIFDHGNWYILSNGTLKIQDRTLDDAKKLADAIEENL